MNALLEWLSIILTIDKYYKKEKVQWGSAFLMYIKIQKNQ